MHAGRPVCTLSLTAHGYHADINGDGVLDHALAVTDATHSHTGHHLHRYLSPCSGYVFTGYPPKAPLFNGTICTPTSRSTANAIFAAHNRPRGSNKNSRTLLMEAPPPVALPAPPSELEQERGTHTHRRHPVYLTSLGDLTMYDHVGTRRWQRRTQATWANAAEDHILDRVVPTLQVLSMRRHAVPTAILAAGTTPRRPGHLAHASTSQKETAFTISCSRVEGCVAGSVSRCLDVVHVHSREDGGGHHACGGLVARRGAAADACCRARRFADVRGAQHDPR